MASGKPNLHALGPTRGARFRSMFPPAKADAIDPKEALTDEQFDALWERMTADAHPPPPDEPTNG